MCILPWIAIILNKLLLLIATLPKYRERKFEARLLSPSRLNWEKNIYTPYTICSDMLHSKGNTSGYKKLYSGQEVKTRTRKINNNDRNMMINYDLLDTTHVVTTIAQESKQILNMIWNDRKLLNIEDFLNLISFKVSEIIDLFNLNMFSWESV